jgi:hypothetical protein
MYPDELSDAVEAYADCEDRVLTVENPSKGNITCNVNTSAASDDTLVVVQGRHLNYQFNCSNLLSGCWSSSRPVKRQLTAHLSEVLSYAIIPPQTHFRALITCNAAKLSFLGRGIMKKD